MTLTSRSPLADVAAAVAAALRDAGIVAVLTGGACATLYSDGAYQSHDLDFILRGSANRRSLDDAMATLGFTRNRDRYVHATTPFFVEFPRGPLAIGDDLAVTPVVLRLRRGEVLALSATDACRDRLAAFYHWADRQSLRTAVLIARRSTVNLGIIRRWSTREGYEENFREFIHELRRAGK